MDRLATRRRSTERPLSEWFEGPVSGGQTHNEEGSWGQVMPEVAATAPEPAAAPLMSSERSATPEPATELGYGGAP